jgi:transcriptional regulator with XRE-family HTH domain
MKVPRTYISKVEMNRTVPTIASLYRIANALEIEIQLLLSDVWTHQPKSAAMCQDPFLQEIALFSKELNPEQRTIILGAVRDAAIHPDTASDFESITL